LKLEVAGQIMLKLGKVSYGGVRGHIRPESTNGQKVIFFN